MSGARGIMDLPPELLARIVTASTSSSDGRVLGPKDRVRLMTVCKAWKACLHPSSLPFDSLYMWAGKTWGPSTVGFIEWVCREQPAVQVLGVEFPWDLKPDAAIVAAAYTAFVSVQRQVLTELRLGMNMTTFVQLFSYGLRLFRQLRTLELTGYGDPEVALTSALFKGLSALQHLHISLASWVIIAGGSEQVQATLLPSLTHLQINSVDQLSIDAALPSLKSVLIEAVGQANLGYVSGSSSLSVPQLTRLELECSLLEVDFRAMPALAALDLHDVEELTASGRLPASLNSLGVHSGGAGHMGAAATLLGLLPQQLLHSLSLDFMQPVDIASLADSLAPQLSRLPSVTNLTSSSPAVLRYLGPALKGGLTQLSLSGCSAMGVSIEDIEALSEMPFLQKLSFGEPMPANTQEDALARRFKVLGRLLFPWCVMVQPGFGELTAAVASGMAIGIVFQ